MLINTVETYLGLIADISIASATEAITKVQQWPLLSEAGKIQLIDQIKCKTVQEPELPPQQPWIYKIKFRSFEHYMSQHSWTTFNGATISDEGKLYTMGAMIMSLGMTVGCLDEGAIAEAACIALFRSSRTESNFFLQATRTLKRQLNMMSDRLRASMPDVPRPTDYPPDIEDFKSRYPAWYTRAFANSPHQACPLDLVMLAAIKARAVARMTKAGCMGVQPRRQGMSNHGMGSHNDLLGLMDQPDNGRTFRRQGSTSDFPLTMLGQYADSGGPPMSPAMEQHSALQLCRSRSTSALRDHPYQHGPGLLALQWQPHQQGPSHLALPNPNAPQGPCPLDLQTHPLPQGHNALAIQNYKPLPSPEVSPEPKGSTKEEQLANEANPAVKETLQAFCAKWGDKVKELKEKEKFAAGPKLNFDSDSDEESVPATKGKAKASPKAKAGAKAKGKGKGCAAGTAGATVKSCNDKKKGRGCAAVAPCKESPAAKAWAATKGGGSGTCKKATKVITKYDLVDSPKAFDKGWFKSGPPKRFGQVTVYVCRKTQIYRVKPGHASRKTDNIIWGRTEEDYLVQWKKVLDKARHYNRVGV